MPEILGLLQIDLMPTMSRSNIRNGYACDLLFFKRDKRMYLQGYYPFWIEANCYHEIWRVNSPTDLLNTSDSLKHLIKDDLLAEFSEIFPT